MKIQVITNRRFGLFMRRNVSISRNRTKIERLLDWKEFPSKSVGRFSFQCLTVQGNTGKPIVSSQSKRRPKFVFKKKTKICFQDRLLLNAGQKYCRMLQESILQYFRPSLSYHLSLRSLICLFLSGCLRQVLLYICPHFQTKIYPNQILCDVLLILGVCFIKLLNKLD